MLCHVWHCVGDWAARRPLAACGQRVHVVCAVNRACCAAIYTVYAVHVWSLVFDPHKKLYTCKKRCACSSLTHISDPLKGAAGFFKRNYIQLHAFERKGRDYIRTKRIYTALYVYIPLRSRALHAAKSKKCLSQNRTRPPAAAPRLHYPLAACGPAQCRAPLRARVSST